MPQLKDDIGIFKISPVTKLNPDNLQFDYKGKKVSFPELDYAIGMMESSGGTNIKPRYEPKYHQQMVQSYKEKKWIPTSAEQKVIGKYGFINATRLFSTSRGKYQIIPETAYRYTSFAGEPKDLDKPEINEKVFKELMQRNYKLSNGDLKKSIYYWNQGSEYFPKLKNYLNEYRSKNKLDLLSSLNPFSVKNAFAEEPDSGKIPPTQSSFVKKSLSLKDDIGILGSINKGIKFLLSPSNRITTKAIPDYEYEKLESWQKEKAQEVSAPSISIGKQKQAKKWYNVPAKMSNLENIAQTGVDLASIGLFAKLGVDELKNIIQNPSVQSKLYQLQQSGRNLLWRGQKLTGMKPPSALVPVTEDISQIEQAVSSGRISLKDAIRVSPVFKAKQIAIRQPGTPEALAREQMVKEQFPSAYEALQPVAGGMVSKELPQIVQKLQTKGITITERLPGIRILQDTSVKDIYGNKITLPAKEEYQEYKLSNNQVLLHDGKNLIVNKNQLKDVENKNLVLGEKKISPEEAQVEEVVKAGTSLQRRKGQIKQELIDAGYNIEPDIGGEIIIVNQQGDEIMPDELETQNPRVFALAEEYSRLQGEFETPALPDDMPKFSQYQLPGGKNYREVLIKAPGGIEIGVPGKELGDYKEWLSQKKFSKGYYEITGGQRLELNAEIEQLKRNQYKSPHWDEPNVLAHIRMNDRITPDGKKVLFIEEIQSDWAKQGRESGFINQKMIEAHQRGDIEYIPEKGMVPYNPLLKNWQELVLKRAIQEAIKGNYDYISWTTGEQQAERYDLSKVVDWIEYNKTKEGIYKLNIKTKTEGVRSIDVFNEEEMARWIPKETAHKIITSGKKHDVLENLDLKIGGEWAKNLYDKQIPNIMKNLTKGEVGSVDLGIKTKKGTGITTQFKKYPIQPVLKITPEIKARVIGQPMAGGLPMKKKESNRLSEGKNLDTEELAELKFEVANTPKTSAERAFSWFHRWIQSQTGRANIITQKQPTQEAIEFYDKPEFKSTKPITVYRAISKGQKESSLKYTSWTTDRDIAENFLEENGKIISKIATPDEIFLVFDKVPKHLRPEVGEDKLGDTEHEVILKPTKKETGAGGKVGKKLAKKSKGELDKEYGDRLSIEDAKEWGEEDLLPAAQDRYKELVSEGYDPRQALEIATEENIDEYNPQKERFIELSKRGISLEKALELSRTVKPTSKETYAELKDIISGKIPPTRPPTAISGAPAPEEPKKEPIINIKNLNISQDKKDKIEQVAEQVKPELEKTKGPLTHDEILQAAKVSQILRKAQSREQTQKLEAALLRTRQQLVTLSKQEKITPEFINTLKLVVNQGTAVARQLESMKILADPEMSTIKMEILKDLLKLGMDTDAIIKASEGIDWNNSEQVTKFYRQFVKPSLSDILNEYAYINILSSPKTHIVNIFSNLLQLSFVNPATKLNSGIADTIATNIFNKSERNHYFSEIPVFYKGVFNAMPSAVSNMLKVLQGQTMVERPDVKRIPTQAKFIKYATLGIGKYIPRALESMDIFFRTMIEGGEIEALSLRTTKQGKELNEVELTKIKENARMAAEKLLFRAPSGQETSYLLKEIDKITGVAYQLRNIKGLQWVLRFIRTPMEIFKQGGFEYSPAGFASVPGSKDKIEQVGKALVGSEIFLAGIILALIGKTTWKAPREEKERKEFFASGRKQFAIQIGDKWYSYARLGVLSYPLAMAAGIHWYMKENPRTVTDTQLERAQQSLLGILEFFAEQSYVREVGNILDSIKADEQGKRSALRAVTNLPKQLIPLVSLQGWVTRLIDPVYRRIDAKTSPQTIAQDLMRGIPGLSKKLPAYTDNEGNLQVEKYPLLNALSPVQVSSVEQEKEIQYQKAQKVISFRALENEQDKQRREKAEQIYRELIELPPREANRQAQEIKKKNPLLYKKIESIAKDKQLGLSYTDRLVKGLGVDNGAKAKYIYQELMTLKNNSERNEYIKDLQKKKIINDKVLQQLKYLIRKKWQEK